MIQASSQRHIKVWKSNKVKTNDTEIYCIFPVVEMIVSMLISTIIDNQNNFIQWLLFFEGMLKMMKTKMVYKGWRSRDGLDICLTCPMLLLAPSVKENPKTIVVKITFHTTK